MINFQIIMLIFQIIKSVHKNILLHSSFSRAKLSGILAEKPILYGDEVSPPVRFVLMTADILGIDIEFHKIDLFKNENRTDFYQKINPLQKVPAMISGSTKIICDSHAISLYLCEKVKDQTLYPDDPFVRAKINQMLFFNASTLFRIDSEILSKYFAQQWPVNNKIKEEWYSAIDYLEYNLKNGPWLLGDKMFLCDVCAVSVVTSVLSLVSLGKRHRRVQEWINRFENLPFYEINKRGLRILQNHIEENRNVLYNSLAIKNVILNQ